MEDVILAVFKGNSRQSWKIYPGMGYGCRQSIYIDSLSSSTHCYNISIIKGRCCLTFPGDYWAYFMRSIDWTFETILEIPLMLNYLYIPWIFSLEKALNIFMYLESHPKIKLGSDLIYPVINDNHFQSCDWVEFFRDSRETIPG